MSIFKQINWRVSILIVLLYFFASSGYNLVGWRYFVPFKYTYILIALAFFFIISYKVKDGSNVIRKYARFLFIWPILVCFSSVLSGHRFITEFDTCYAWVCYIGLFFVFHKYKIKEVDIITGLALSAIICAAIQIYQQTDSAVPLFGIISEESDQYMGDIAQIRNGMYRFNVGNLRLPLLMSCFYWCKIVRERNISNASLLALFLISVYLYLTRQVMIALATTFVLSIVINSEGKNKNSIFIGILTLFLVVSFYWNELFGDLLQTYSDDTSTTDIRFEALIYYISAIKSHILNALIGFGHGTNIQQYGNNNFLYVDDIGFVGEMFLYGIAWVVYYFYMLYFLLIKNRKEIPTYVVLFIIATFLTSIMIFPYRKGAEMFIWACVLYIADTHISSNNNLIIKNNE